MTMMKRVVRYLKGTISIGPTYSEDAKNGDEATAYVDADRAGDMDKLGQRIFYDRGRFLLGRNAC